MDLQEAVASGLFVEFRDALGNSAGTAVYFDWNGHPVPAVGDRVTCQLAAEAGADGRLLAGYVRSRTFEMQQTDDGRPCVWVRLIVNVTTSPARVKNRLAAGLSFSRN